jgi:hypothetical protein
MNKYIFYCNNCSFKKIINDNSDLEGFVFVKSSPIQAKIPQIDYPTGSIREPTNTSQPKKIKCPNCGFSNRPKIVKEEEKKDEQTNNIDGR